jgi:TrmH family RNA methyltransferase
LDRAPSIAARFAALADDPARVRLEGLHPLKHALRFGGEVELAVSPDPRALLALARTLCPDLLERLEALVEPVPAGLFAALGPPPPSPVLAIARRPRVDTSALLAPSGPAPVLLLDRPVHAGNLGAVVRVAAALGAAGVLTLGGVDPWSPAALRGSSGLHFALPVARLERLGEPVERPLVALHPEGPILDPAAPTALPPGALLAFGSERHGLDPALRARAGAVLAIPMRPGVSSLNLATAAAIVLWEARRRLPPEPRAG